ncbi:tyrosine-type recombinase/integrase [Maricaulis sp. CAU 1757]
MTGKKLTKRCVDAAAPGTTVWDSELPGFGLRVSEKGTKSYVLKYRFHGRQRWFTIGQHGRPAPALGDSNKADDEDAHVWTPDRARREANRLLGGISAGIDPAGVRAADRAAENLKTFSKRYIRDHVDAHTKASTAKETKRILAKYVLPKLGHIRVKDLSRAEVAKFHTDMKAQPYQANRCLAVVSHMLAKAEEWGIREDAGAVCRSIKKYREAKRERFLSASEVKALADALEDAKSKGLNPFALTIIRLLAVTGARRQEIEALQWSEVDQERGVLRLGDSKTGAKVIPLAPAARLILSETPRIKGARYVFPAASGDSHYQGLGKVWREIRKSAGLDGVRLHDLRHTFASFGAAGGLSLPLIGALLGHKQAATTQRYAHLADDPVQRAAEQTGNAVAAAMAGGRDKRTSVHHLHSRGENNG